MEVLRSARLILRTWDVDDLAPLYALNQDPRVHEFLPGPMSMAQAEVFTINHNALQAAQGMCYWALELVKSGELVGFAGLKPHTAGLPFAPCVDIGWRLGVAHWGKGLASEAARACLAHGFGPLELNEIVSFTVPENLCSRRVMENIGMQRITDGDFDHPALDPGHRLARHVLYRATPGPV